VDELWLTHYYQVAFHEPLADNVLPRETLLENLKLARADYLTLAGLLLFGKDVALHRPQFGIRATVYLTPDAFRDKEDIGGNLFQQHQQGVDFILRNLHRRPAPGQDFNAAGALEIPAAAWDAILDVLMNPTELEAKLREAQQAELEALEPRRAELATVEALLAEAEKEAEQLATAITKATGVVSRVLEEKTATLDERYQALKARRDELKAALAIRMTEEATISGMLAYARRVEIGLDHATNDDKRQVLEAFDARIIVKDGAARLLVRLDKDVSIALQPPQPVR